MFRISSILCAFTILYCFHCSSCPVSVATTIQNGDITISLDVPPKRAITMNQSATEIMLALGLEKAMVGTAYLDDTILPEFAATYLHIPVLSEKYPSKEIMFDVAPDFVYAGYASAFSPRRGLADRKELSDLAINSYLSPSELLEKSSPWTIDLLYKEIWDIGKIFQVEQRAEHLIATIEQKFNRTQTDTKAEDKPRILWLDSFRERELYVGAGTGVPNEIIQLAGGVNVLADVEGKWVDISKELIIDRPVDVIVTINAKWGSSANKQKILKEDPLYRYLDAVQNNRFVVIEFSASTPGIRVPEAVSQLHGALSSFGLSE